MSAEALTLDEASAGHDPFALFERWLAAAVASEPNDPTAMTLATVDAQGLPDARMVLMRGHGSDGFVFFTNFESAKGRQILETGRGALLFHWKSLRRQVRARGPMEVVTEREADDYFASRPRGSRVGAWASQQSRPIASRAALEEAVAAVERRHEGGEVPRPPHWSGFRLRPLSIEFWQDGEFRLHDRIRFTRDTHGADWRTERLSP